MKILTVINHEDAPLALVGEHLEARGGEPVEVNPHDGGRLPASAEGFDGLAVLGGTMSAADRAYDAVFGPLTALVRAFHAADKPVLGICLGSQLIARAFAKPVFPHHEVEFGFVPLMLTEAGAGDPLLAGLGRRQHLFQWHEDTFEVPDGAALLMTGEGCRNQAFRVGGATYGFQCHFEATEELIRRWLRLGGETFRRQLGPRAAGLEAELDGALARHMADARAFARTVSERWLDLVARKSRKSGYSV